MSTAKNKNSGDNTIPTEKKNPCPNLQKPDLFFFRPGCIFKMTMCSEKKKEGLHSEQCYSVRSPKRPQISFWQPWNPSPLFTGLWSTAPTVFPYVNHAAFLWREVNKRNTHSQASNISTALEDGTISWLQREEIFEDMNSYFLHK